MIPPHDQPRFVNKELAPFGGATSASGGTGTVANLQVDDDVNYTVAKGATASIGGFPTYGSAITSVYLFVQYTVETGYSGTGAIKVNGVNTPIVEHSLEIRQLQIHMVVRRHLAPVMIGNATGMLHIVQVDRLGEKQP